MAAVAICLPSPFQTAVIEIGFNMSPSVPFVPLTISPFPVPSSHPHQPAVQARSRPASFEIVIPTRSRATLEALRLSSNTPSLDTSSGMAKPNGVQNVGSKQYPISIDDEDMDNNESETPQRSADSELLGPTTPISPRDLVLHDGGLACKWIACDAVMACPALAAKHYRKHQLTTPVFHKTRRCGYKHCHKRMLPQEIERHFLDAHVGRARMMTGDAGEPIDVKPQAPTNWPPHSAIPAGDTLPYLISTEPVPPAVGSTVDDVLPIAMRRSLSSGLTRFGPSNLRLSTLKEPIVPERGDQPFWPTCGDDKVQHPRNASSSIFAYHGERSSRETPDERLCDYLRSSAPFTHPAAISGPDAAGPSRPKRVYAPMEIVTRVYTGTIPLTIPPVVVFAAHLYRQREAKRTAGPEDSKGKRRAPGERPQEDKEPAGPTAKEEEVEFPPKKIRRAARRCASRRIGRSVGTAWWETLYEFQDLASVYNISNKGVEFGGAPPLEGVKIDPHGS